ncbi:MAG: riboflavin synthase [Pirellulales bacterium]|nr:riboflavin synthase [Pirellulales bacterium]
MFSGIVAALGTVDQMQPSGPGARLVVREPKMAGPAKIGDSIAVNGCCLTVVEVKDQTIAFDAGPETLARTNLGECVPGVRVNLETSLRLGEELGGHFVTGHIDSVGTVDLREDDEEWSTFWFRVPRILTRQMASKGSVAVDGVSLTLVVVEEARFSVALIPYTLAVTTLGHRQPGDRVNIETDILAKYVQRQLEFTGSA